jgi:ribonuclease HI
MMAAQCCVRMGVADRVVAEAMAAMNALRLCIDQGLSNICIEGDAKNVVEAVQPETINWSKIGHVMADAKLLGDRFEAWEINHVGHQANSAAHSLAKLAACMGLNRLWPREIPNCISEIIRREQFLISFD